MFKELKLKKNSKVAIKFDNSIEYTLLSFFFILKGFVLIPINPKLKKNEINEILQISKSKIFFSNDKKKYIIKNIYFKFTK